MAFQFSHQFHRHWLDAPAHTRRQIKADLQGIIDLLKKETKLTDWQKKHGIYNHDTTKAEQVSLFETEEINSSEIKSESQVTTPVNSSDFLSKVTQPKSTTKTKKQEQKVHSAFESVELDKNNLANSTSVKLNENVSISNSEKAFLEDFEQKVDEYLQIQHQQMKTELMQWAQHALAQFKSTI